VLINFRPKGQIGYLFLEEDTLNQLEILQEIQVEILQPLQADIYQKYHYDTFINFEWDFHRGGLRFRLSSFKYKKAILDKWPEELFSVDWKKFHIHNIDIKNHVQLPLDVFRGVVPHLLQIEVPEITDIDPFDKPVEVNIQGTIDRDLVEDLIERSRAYDHLRIADTNLGYFPRSTEYFRGFRLDLYNTGIERIPRFLVNNHSIRYLDLMLNKIKEIPPWISDIPHLRWLHLIKNQVRFIPRELYKSSIKQIVISEDNSERYKWISRKERRKKGWKRQNNPWFNSLEEIPKEYELCRILYRLGLNPPKPKALNQSAAHLHLPPYFRKRTELKWKTTLLDEFRGQEVGRRDLTPQ